MDLQIERQLISMKNILSAGLMGLTFLVVFLVADGARAAAEAATGDVDIDIDAELDAAVESADSAKAADDQDLPEIGEDRLQVFVLDRGFYFTSDLGVFFTFGGARGYSNVQPFLSLKAGFDINDWLSAQLVVSSGYASGNPANEFDAVGSGSLQTRSFSLTSIGPELVYAYRPTQRIAIEPRLGGGVTYVYPQISRSDSTENAYSNFLPHISGGVDVKYLTLLTNFTAGISTTFEYIIGPNVPALGVGFVVRYTM